MWKCPVCNLQFVSAMQAHSCSEKELFDFLAGKNQHSVILFYHLVNEFAQIGKITVNPTKSMIAFAAVRRFAYVIQIGKNFIDVVLPFKQRYDDNLCFNKIKQVPGTNDYNHHLRLFNTEDINKEVKKFMEMAYKNVE